MQASTLKTETENKSTFYGSEIDNEFICRVKKCEFAGWYGSDIYEEPWFIPRKQEVTIKDFQKKRLKKGQLIADSDKIFFSTDNLKAEKLSKSILLTATYNNEVVKVFLEGVSLEDVKGWLKIAKLDPKTDSYYDKVKNKTYTGKELERFKLDNPIQTE